MDTSLKRRENITNKECLRKSHYYSQNSNTPHFLERKMPYPLFGVEIQVNTLAIGAVIVTLLSDCYERMS